MSKIGSIILKIKLYQNYWINRKLLSGHFYNPLLVVKKWALFLSAHMQLSSSQFKSWLCSTVLNNCGHTYIVSYYHNNSPYGTHTKTQKRIPLSLKHNFPTHNVTKLFHKSFLKSCVSMISENFYSKNLGILEYFRKENSFGFKYSNAISSYGTIPTGDVVNIDRYQKCYFSPLFHFAAIYIST